MGTAAFAITSASVTAWQIGNLRVGLDRDKRTVLDSSGDPKMEDIVVDGEAAQVPIEEEIYMKTVSFSRYRDHENVSAVAQIFSDADPYSGLALQASMHGTALVNVSLSPEYDASDPSSGTQVWYIQDTTMEPMEVQGSKFIRETQEWTAQLPEWVQAPWQAFS